jgi:hypothetical protein
VSHDRKDRVMHGAAEIARSVSAALEGVVSVHHGHMPEIELTSSDTATGVWAMEDRLWFPPGSPVEFLHGYGHYHETYRREDGRWRIATLTLTRIRRDLRFAEPGS